MKKIAYLICLILFVETVDAQVAGRCLVCPPTLSGVPDGWCLKDSSGYAVWGPCADAADSVLWHSGNGNLYPANLSLNVGIGTKSPLGKLTVEDTAHSLTWGYVYNPLFMENTYGNFVRDGAHIYGSINQNPTGGEHYQGMLSIDTTTGAGVQLFVNYSGSEDGHEIILRNDNPADTSKNIVLTVSDTGIVVSNPLTFAPFFKIDGTGQMRYYKTPINGGVLASNAIGNATWQPASTTPLDSAAIYALTPTLGTQYYCTNCSGNGITGRIVAYIGAAWRRLTFE